MPSVIVLDDLAPEGLDSARRGTKGSTYEVRTGLKGDDLREGGPQSSSTAPSAAAA